MNTDHFLHEVRSVLGDRKWLLAILTAIPALAAADRIGALATIRLGEVGGPFGYMPELRTSLGCVTALTAYWILHDIRWDSRKSLWQTLPLSRTTQLFARFAVLSVASVLWPAALAGLTATCTGHDTPSAEIGAVALTQWVFLWLGAYAATRQPTPGKATLHTALAATLALLSSVAYATMASQQEARERNVLPLIGVTLGILLPPATLLVRGRKPGIASYEAEGTAWAALIPACFLISARIYPSHEVPPDRTLPPVIINAGTARPVETYDSRHGLIHRLAFDVPNYPRLQVLRNTYRMTITRITLVAGNEGNRVSYDIPVTRKHAHLMQIEMPETPDILPALICGKRTTPPGGFAQSTGSLHFPDVRQVEFDIDWQQARGKTLVIEALHEVWESRPKLLGLLPADATSASLQISANTAESYRIDRTPGHRWEITGNRLSVESRERNPRGTYAMNDHHLFLVRRDTGERLNEARPYSSGRIHRGMGSGDFFWEIRPSTSAMKTPEASKALALVNFAHGERVAIPVKLTVSIPAAPNSAASHTPRPPR